MNRRIFLFAMLTFVGFINLHAQDAPAPAAPEAPIISTTACQAYPQVTCTSADALASSDALQLAADVHRRAAGEEHDAVLVQRIERIAEVRLWVERRVTQHALERRREVFS